MKISVLAAGLTASLSLFSIHSLATDSDGDGVPDDIESALGMNPQDATDFFNDTDGDGVFDGEEALDGTDLNDPNSFVDMLDRTIGVNGLITETFLPSTDYDLNVVDSIAQDSAGNVYLAGELDGDEVSFYLAKWKSDWTLDESFSDDGYVVGSDYSFLGETVFQIETNVIDQPLILMNQCISDTCLVSFDESGTLNTARFNSEAVPGVFEISGSMTNTRKSLVAESGERYIGYTASASDRKVRVIKLTANEQIDSTFNSGLGYVEINIFSDNSTENFTGLWTDNHSDLLIGIRTYSMTSQTYGIHLAKIDTSGLLDPTWGNQGILEITGDHYYRDFNLIADTESGFWLHSFIDDGPVEGVSIIRLDDAGERVATFADNGEFIFANHSNVEYEPLTFAVQPDGKIISANWINRGMNPAAVMAFKLTSEGVLDETFYSDGIARLTLDSNSFDVNTATILNNHDIAFSGSYDNQGEFSTGIYIAVIPNESDLDGDGIEDFEDPIDNRNSTETPPEATGPSEEDESNQEQTTPEASEEKEPSESNVNPLPTSTNKNTTKGSGVSTGLLLFMLMLAFSRNKKLKTLH